MGSNIEKVYLNPDLMYVVETGGKRYEIMAPMEEGTIHIFTDQTISIRAFGQVCIIDQYIKQERETEK